jgi:xanthine dehydrogenase accessory factor
VVETQRGHNLGKVILSGSAAADSGVPGSVAGFSRERVLYAPTGGLLSAVLAIGDRVKPGQLVARVGDELVTATIGGVLRGLLHDGLAVHSGQKLGDIDPRGIRDYCFTISDKARSIGGGVLEAILCLSGAPSRA